MNNMKRSIILIAAALFVMVGWSQTMTINFKDGSVVNQNVSNISSFEITDDNQSDNGDNQGDNDTQGENQEIRKFIVGTWIETKETSYPSDDVTLGVNYIQFNSDGTWFSVTINDNKGATYISKGKWYVYEDSIIVNTKEGRWTFYPIKWAVKSINSNQLILNYEKITAYLTKVQDNEIERYLPSNFKRTYNSKGSYDSKENRTITIDGEPYFSTQWSSAEQSRRYGMYLHIRAAPTIIPYKPSSYRELTINIGTSYVSELTVGEVFTPMRGSSASYNSNSNWIIVEGSITIMEITDYYLTVKLDNIKIKRNNQNLEHTISGIAVLHSGTWNANIDLLSFKEAE